MTGSALGLPDIKGIDRCVGLGFIVKAVAVHRRNVSSTAALSRWWFPDGRRGRGGFMLPRPSHGHQQVFLESSLMFEALLLHQLKLGGLWRRQTHSGVAGVLLLAEFIYLLDNHTFTMLFVESTGRHRRSGLTACAAMHRLRLRPPTTSTRPRHAVKRRIIAERVLTRRTRLEELRRGVRRSRGQMLLETTILHLQGVNLIAKLHNQPLLRVELSYWAVLYPRTAGAELERTQCFCQVHRTLGHTGHQHRLSVAA